MLAGLVYDAAVGPSHPIAGAVVSITMCGPRTFQVLTGSDGRYSLFLPGEYLDLCTQVTLRCWAAGYWSFEQVILVADLHAQPVRDIALQASASPTPTETAQPVARNLLPIVLRGHSQALPSPTPTHTPIPTWTPTSTPTSTPGPSLTPTPSATATRQALQLIINPSFETDEGWQIPRTVYPASYSVSRAHSGQRSVRLGLAPGGNLFSYSSVQQTVDIPSWVTQANLTFHYFPLMAPDPGDLIYFCVLRASDDAILECNFWAHYDQTWTLGSFDLSKYAGQRVKVHFGVRNDGMGGISAVYVDDVELWVR